MRHLYLSLSLLLSLNLSSQSFDYQRSVMLSAEVQADPPTITLSWDQEVTATSLTLYRRAPGASTWGAPLSTLSPADTQFIDTDVAPGERYEYRLRRGNNNIFGNGYLYSGIRLPAADTRGVLLLLVDSLLAQPLEMEIQRLCRDLEGDGWEVKKAHISQSWPVSAVKDTIVQLYNQAPNHTHSVFLLGHLPVPYSGNINPDGHGNHIGAWPADGYYGDIDGNWTDQSVSNTSASQSRNHNVPGDGKFDQSIFPSKVELAVGRVDFHQLPAFSLSAIELTRRYLDKDHAFRNGQLSVPHRGLIENNFGNFNEGFGQNGLKNFAPLLGRDSFSYADYSKLKSAPYLWSYGCGAGSYTNANGIINTNNLATDSVQAVFTMLFGSYFGDWDSNNNLLRAALGSGAVLANAWAGRPNWQFHPMGMGAPIGECVLLSQNNTNFEYDPGVGNRMIHIALMGDPSLRMSYPQPVSGFQVEEQNGHAFLSWSATPDSKGFLVYRKEAGGAFERLTGSLLQSPSFWDSCLVGGATYIYQVRAVRLEESPSGSYWNSATGRFDTLTVQTDLSVNAAFSILPSNNSVQLQNQSAGATTFAWDFGDGNSSMEANPQHTYAVAGNYTITLVASNDCFADTLSQEVEIVTSVKEEASTSAVIVYPNPSSGKLFIELRGATSEAHCFLLNSRGKWLGSYAISRESNTLDLSGLPSGQYIIRLEISEEIISRKVNKL